MPNERLVFDNGFKITMTTTKKIGKKKFSNVKNIRHTNWMCGKDEHDLLLQNHSLPDVYAYTDTWDIDRVPIARQSFIYIWVCSLVCSLVFYSFNLICISSKL